MTDTDKLKRLAEAANVVHRDANGRLDGRDAERIWFEYLDAANPKAILALIAERKEAVALLRHCYEEPMEPWHEVSAFLARIDADNKPMA